MHDLNRIVSGVIYYLHNGDNIPRYIGYTTQLPITRLRQHKNEADAGESGGKNNWIRSIGSANLHMEIMEVCSEVPLWKLYSIEVAHITAGYAKGYDLTNGTPGGEGVPPGTKPWNTGKKVQYSEEHLQKIRNSLAGNQYMLGRKHTDEAKAKVSAARAGKPLSEEHKRRISEGGKGVPKSEETKARMRLAQHKRNHTDRNIVKEGCPSCSQ